MELHNGTKDDGKDSIDFWEWKDEDYCLTSNPASGFLKKEKKVELIPYLILVFLILVSIFSIAICNLTSISWADYIWRHLTADFANLLWDDLNQDENDLLQLLGDQTPMKECMDFENVSFGCGDYTDKGFEEEIPEPPSMVKRRKMLQFTADSNGEDANKNPITSSTLTSVSSTSSNGVSESLLIGSDSVSNYPETVNVLPRGGLDQSSEWWGGNSTPEKLSYYSSDETSCSKNHSVSPFDKINIPGLADGVADGECEVVEQTTKLSTLKIFKGKKTVIKAPKKITSSVAYPFTIIKSFGVQEGVTLDDINTKIHAPPVIKKKLQHIGNFAYPISQFSGKPVVGKKKISTEGGKGSITVLRTKG